MISASQQPILEVRDLTKSFGSVPVLSGVSFTLAPGTVLGLAGENGAGKSTLAKCISGVHRPTSGEIVLRGDCYVVPQEFSLISTLRVYENVFLGREISRFGFLAKSQMIRRTKELLDMIGCPISPDAVINDLGVAERQKVEIAKAFLVRSNLLILDEPTTVLSRSETETLFRIIREFTANGGSVIYISHKLEEVRTICDRIVVLRDGVLVADEKASELSAMEIARKMVGRNLIGIFPEKENIPENAEIVFSCKNFSSGKEVRHVSFSLRKGEILGFAGLAGAGRTELAEAICGFRRHSGGSLAVNGRRIFFVTPFRMKKAGVAYLPEDRQRTAVLPDFSVLESITLASLRKYVRNGLVSRAQCLASTERYIERFRIKTNSPDEKMKNLSGGNQQKVVIARGLDTDPSVFIFDEPTRGVDVGARREIYDFIHDLARTGVSCILISSDLEEIIGNCSRVAVMRNGRIEGEVSGEQVTEEQIMFLATGVNKK